MDDLMSYARMGGYAAYVWPSFAITLAVLGGLAWTSVRSLKRAERALARIERDGATPGMDRGLGAAQGAAQGPEAGR